MQSINIHAEFLSKDLDAGLDLLMDAILHPAFQRSRDEESGRAVRRQREVAEGQSGRRRRRVLSVVLLWRFASVRPSRGRVELMPGSAPEDIAEFHKRMFVGRNMIVAVAGDVDPAAATKTLGRCLREVPAGSRLTSGNRRLLRRRNSTRIAVIDKPDATQTQFLIGQPGIERSHPDRVPLWVVNTIFGGRFTSILNDEFRVNSGLTYGASSRFDQTHLPGRITIASFTKTETTGKAIDLALDTAEATARERYHRGAARIGQAVPERHLSGETGSKLPISW